MPDNQPSTLRRGLFSTLFISLAAGSVLAVFLIRDIPARIATVTGPSWWFCGDFAGIRGPANLHKTHGRDYRYFERCRFTFSIFHSNAG